MAILIEAYRMIQAIFEPTFEGDHFAYLFCSKFEFQLGRALEMAMMVELLIKFEHILG